MILNSLILKDFCLFAGEQELILSPSRGRGRELPVVLFGGVNGAGKTTVLDAVQLALYGQRARCSKRFDKPFELFLRESIHRNADPADGASVRLNFTYASGGEDHLYEVNRSWSVARGRVRERIRVERDGIEDTWLSENWSQVVEELLPSGIADLCFFDAEKIRFLADDETSNQELGQSIKSLLGLDLVERLILDSSVLQSRLIKQMGEVPESEALISLEQQLEENQSEVDHLLQTLSSIQVETERAENRLSLAETYFNKVGGKHWEERDEHRKRVADQQGQRQETRFELQTLAAGALPLALIPDLLSVVRDQSTREGDVRNSDHVSKVLEERDAWLSMRMEEKSVQKKTRALIEKFLSEDRTARTDCDTTDIRLDLSPSAFFGLNNLLEGRFDSLAEEVEALKSKHERMTRTIEDSERSLAAAPADKDLADPLAEIKEASADLATVAQRLRGAEEELLLSRNKRDDLAEQYDKLRRKFVDADIADEQNARMLSSLSRTRDTMTEFLKRTTASKIDHLSDRVSESFRFLLHKTTLVERVSINPETFAITLYDKGGQMIPKQNLSEGEKQIFAVSVLWGLSRAASRPLPAIIDTPMARLDVQHRDSLVNRYFPNASHQVIILSTDSEVDKDYSQELEPHIARAYHLDYDDELKQTIARKGYFWNEDAPETLVGVQQ